MFDPFFLCDLVVHVHRAAEDDEDLRTVVHMPHIGFVRPVESGRRRVELAEVDTAPQGRSAVKVLASLTTATSTTSAPCGPDDAAGGELVCTGRAGG